MLKYAILLILSGSAAMAQPLNCPGNSCKPGEPIVAEVPSMSVLNSQVNNAPVRSVTRNVGIYSFGTSNRVSGNVISSTAIGNYGISIVTR